MYQLSEGVIYPGGFLLDIRRRSRARHIRYGIDRLDEFRFEITDLLRLKFCGSHLYDVG